MIVKGILASAMALAQLGHAAKPDPFGQALAEGGRRLLAIAEESHLERAGRIVRERQKLEQALGDLRKLRWEKPANEDPRWPERAAIVNELGGLAGKYEQAMEAVIRSLDDAHPEVRKTAVRILSSFLMRGLDFIMDEVKIRDAIRDRLLEKEEEISVILEGIEAFSKGVVANSSAYEYRAKEYRSVLIKLLKRGNPQTLSAAIKALAPAACYDDNVGVALYETRIKEAVEILQTCK